MKFKVVVYFSGKIIRQKVFSAFDWKDAQLKANYYMAGWCLGDWDGMMDGWDLVVVDYGYGRGM